MGIFVDIKKEDDPADQVGDWYVFVVVIATTVFLLLCDIFVIRYRNNAIMSTKNITNIMFISLSSVLHIWGTFVTGEHLTYMKNVKLDACSMWTFLFTYTLGLDIWITAMIIRVLDYAIAGNVMQLKKEKRVFIYHMSSGIMLYFPLFLLSTVAWLIPASYPVNGACQTMLEWKTVMAVSFGIYMMIFVGVVCCYGRRIENTVYDESRKMRIILPLSIIFLVVGVSINLADVLNTYIGRIIYTLSICIFHITIFIILCGYELFKSIRGDKEYTSRILRRFRNNTTFIGLKTCEDLKNISDAWEDFLSYCSKQGQVYDLSYEYFIEENVNRPKISKTLLPCSGAALVTLLSKIMADRDVMDDMNHDIKLNSDFLGFLPLEIKSEILSSNEMIVKRKYAPTVAWIEKILSANFLETYKQKEFKEFLKISNDPHYENATSVRLGLMNSEMM